METAFALVSGDSAALGLAGCSHSAAAGWASVAGGCFSAGAALQSDHLRLPEASVLDPLKMASVLVAEPAFLKTLSIPDDVRKGLVHDQLENTGVSMPTKAWEEQMESSFIWNYCT